MIRYAIAAPPRHGKTTTLLALARGLARAGTSCTGVAQPALYQGGRVVGYELVDIPSGERRPFAKRRGHPSSSTLWSRDRLPTPGALPFRFDDTGLAWAAARIQRPADVLLVDELGWLEAAGHGHLPALQTALSGGLHRAVVLAVRMDALPAIEAHLGSFRVLSVPTASAAAFTHTLRDELKKENCR